MEGVLLFLSSSELSSTLGSQSEGSQASQLSVYDDNVDTLSLQSMTEKKKSSTL